MMVHSVLIKSWKQHPTNRSCAVTYLPSHKKDILPHTPIHWHFIICRKANKKKKLHSSILYGHRVPSWKITSSDYWYGQLARESLRNMNCRYALMMMKIMILFQHHVKMGIAVFCLSTYRYLFSSFVMVSQIIPL